MDKNLTGQTNHRISGKAAPISQFSSPSPIPGQNERFSDGFLTKSRIVTGHTIQPGKTSDQENPMKSQEIPPGQGLPPCPPFPKCALRGRPASVMNPRDDGS